MQDILSKMNESERELYPFPHLADDELYNCLIGEKSQAEARKWLSPPDPWKNHNTACESHYEGTSTWLIKGGTFAKWKSSGPDSLLWIHGKRGCLYLTRPIFTEIE